MAKAKQQVPGWKPQGMAREDLVERVSNDLREEIIKGTFKAGENLPGEAELAEAYQVSRRVIRETMRILCALGLVEIHQGKRPMVLPVGNAAAIHSMHVTLRRSDCRYAHLYEVRRPVELECVRLAAERATEEDIAAIGTILDIYDKASEGGRVGDYERRMKADIDFHTRISQATHNPAMELVYGAICQIFGQYYQQHRKFMQQLIQENVQTGRHSALKHHRNIFDAIKAHDPDAAEKAARDHLDRSVFVMSLMEKDASEKSNVS